MFQFHFRPSTITPTTSLVTSQMSNTLTELRSFPHTDLLFPSDPFPDPFSDQLPAQFPVPFPAQSFDQFHQALLEDQPRLVLVQDQALEDHLDLEAQVLNNQNCIRNVSKLLLFVSHEVVHCYLLLKNFKKYNYIYKKRFSKFFFTMQSG
jgi:hypothetical protein